MEALNFILSRGNCQHMIIQHTKTYSRCETYKMIMYFKYTPPLQFLTFAERLGNVNIDIIHRIDRTASYDEVREC